MSDKISKTDEEWRKTLTEEQFNVTRMKGTERSFSGKYYRFDDDGTYNCICCGSPLFKSDTKFDAGCGWPSYYEPITPDAVIYEDDKTHGMIRTEVRCGKCDAHLGHVFEDGPEPSGQRFCINSVALDFDKNKTE